MNGATAARGAMLVLASAAAAAAVACGGARATPPSSASPSKASRDAALEPLAPSSAEPSFARVCDHAHPGVYAVMARLRARPSASDQAADLLTQALEASGCVTLLPRDRREGFTLYFQSCNDSSGSMSLDSCAGHSEKAARAGVTHIVVVVVTEPADAGASSGDAGAPSDVAVSVIDASRMKSIAHVTASAGSLRASIAEAVRALSASPGW